jgi:hypothetical protein
MSSPAAQRPRPVRRLHDPTHHGTLAFTRSVIVQRAIASATLRRGFGRQLPVVASARHFAPLAYASLREKPALIHTPGGTLSIGASGPLFNRR